jgi:hypothetical protein
MRCTGGGTDGRVACPAFLDDSLGLGEELKKRRIPVRCGGGACTTGGGARVGAGG